MSLADVGVERCWILEVDALPLEELSPESAAFGDGGFGEYAFGEDPLGETGGEELQLFSSNGFISAAADTPPHRHYDGRIKDDVHVIRRILDQDEGFGGLVRVFAEVALTNADGGLDLLQSEYALDGRGCRLLIGHPSAAKSTFDTVFTGYVVTAPVNSKELRVSMSDAGARLELPVNRNAYAGTGTLEGGNDLKGKPKPKCWGSVQNVPAPLVNGTLLIFQAHDGSLSGVPAVYDRGIALTPGADYATQDDLINIAPSAGQYRVYKAGGYFRLGSTPSGLVTADVLGDNSGSGYINKTADIVSRVLVDQAAFDSATEFNTATFTQLNVDAPAEVGVWTGVEVLSIGAVLNRLLVGVGAYGGFNRSGLFTVAVIKAPDGTSVKSFTREHIYNLEREPLPGAVEPVVWRARVAWQHNYAVQNDLASGATAARRAFASQQVRLAERSDVTVRSKRTLAREYGPTGNLYAQQADADTEAVRLMALWSVPRGMYRLELPPEALSVDLADAIDVTHPRFGFTDGVQARVLWHEVRRAKVILKVFA
jgi:hypothetical protein